MMPRNRPMCLAAAAVMLMLCVPAMGGTAYIRHQFSYMLKDPSKAPSILTTLFDLLKNLPTKPQSARPLAYSLGRDISKPPFVQTPAKVGRVHVGGWADFPNLETLQAYFKYLTSNATFLSIGPNLISSQRWQYFLSGCTYPTTPTYKFFFSYNSIYNFSAITAASTGRGMSLIQALCSHAPVKPITCDAGADLGLQPLLYPTLAPNYIFGGSVEFATEKEVQIFADFALANKEVVMMYTDPTARNVTIMTTNSTAMKYAA